VSQQFDINTCKCKSISFRHNMQPIEFVYSTDLTALKRVDEIKDLGVIMDSKRRFCLISISDYFQIVENDEFY
jgi:hypothetical protein